MATAPLSCQKAHFQLPEGLHYLNCAYMGPLPRAAEDAGIRALRIKRDPTAIGPADFFEESDRVREKFARIMGAPDAGRVAIHPAVSYGIATAARNLPLSRGARIVLVEEQFPGNVYAWRRLAGEAGGSLHTVARPGGGEIGPEWNARILEAITPVTEIVTLPTVHWTDGTRFDLAAIGARVREVGAALVVDATQSCGAAPFDFAAVRPDVFVMAHCTVEERGVQVGECPRVLVAGVRQRRVAPAHRASAQRAVEPRVPQAVVVIDGGRVYLGSDGRIRSGV